MSPYTQLIWIGEAQAWLAKKHNRADSLWTKLWTRWCWGPLRAVFCFGCWAVGV